MKNMIKIEQITFLTFFFSKFEVQIFKFYIDSNTSHFFISYAVNFPGKVKMNDTISPRQTKKKNCVMVSELTEVKRMNDPVKPKKKRHQLVSWAFLVSTCFLLQSFQNSTAKNVRFIVLHGIWTENLFFDLTWSCSRAMNGHMIAVFKCYAS